MKKSEFSGMRVLIMGLGVNGGGLESARYLAKLGAELTITDLRDEKVLSPSMEALSEFTVRYVLGKHEAEDFRNADLVIKNPGVRPDSTYLADVKRIETDISLFLYENPAILSCVTGTKGKSSTSSALYHVLDEASAMGLIPGKAYLGGNITISPLSFLDVLKKEDNAVLELSSFQLGDLRGKDVLKPRSVIMTPIMRDHLDRYGDMETYINDKRVIYKNQDSSDVIIASNDSWGMSFINESKARPLLYSLSGMGEIPPGFYGGWIDPEGQAFGRLLDRAGNLIITELVPPRPLVPGIHQKQNLLSAALALYDMGLDADFIRESLGRFKGIDHRLEFFHEANGAMFYNDSSATIPEAAAAAIKAFEDPPVIVCGGTDKDLDFKPLAAAAVKAREIVLLSGTGTVKLIKLLDEAGIKYRGPYDSLGKVMEVLGEIMVPDDRVLLSPGCASFGMFTNEFDRGNKWKEEVQKFFA